MAFSNPITGGQGTLVRPAIKSPDYVPGVSGWSINRDGSAEFNDLDIRGVFTGDSFVMNADGLFFYSPTPGAGNLVGSWTPTVGTDPYGNDYEEGVTVYSGSEFAELDSGNLYLGVKEDPITPFGPVNGLVGVVSGGDAIFLQSASNTAEPDYSTLRMQAGIHTLPRGDFGRPHIFAGESSPGEQDFWLSGAAVYCGFQFPETWHTVGAAGEPAFNTGWSGTTTIGTLTNMSSLRFRFGVEDNVYINGLFTAASGAGTSVVQLPSAYRPKVNTPPLPVTIRSSAGTVTQVEMYVSSAGNLNVNSNLGSGVTAGSVYALSSVQFPLGNMA